MRYAHGTVPVAVVRPGQRGDAERAAAAVDVLIIDLEDAAAEKGRAEACGLGAAPGAAGDRVRARQASIPASRIDVMAVVRKGWPAWCRAAGAGHPRPRCYCRGGLAAAARACAHADHRSARGLLRCGEIALASTARRLAVGGGPPRSSACRTAAALHLRSVVRVVAYGPLQIDTPYTDTKDDAGLAKARAIERRLRGSLIHPGQVAAVNGIFAPSAREIAEARRIVAAAERRGDGTWRRRRRQPHSRRPDSRTRTTPSRSRRPPKPGRGC
jgi:citrate lyase beta subunit